MGLPGPVLGHSFHELPSEVARDREIDVADYVEAPPHFTTLITAVNIHGVEAMLAQAIGVSRRPLVSPRVIEQSGPFTTSRSVPTLSMSARGRGGPLL